MRMRRLIFNLLQWSWWFIDSFLAFRHSWHVDVITQYECKTQWKRW